MLQIFGQIQSPLLRYGSVFEGLVPLLNNFLRLIFVIAGLYAVLNFIIAGFGFMTAGGDPKTVEKSWSRIWQSLVGLVIIVSSFLLAVIFGYLIFGKADAILNPTISGPVNISACNPTECDNYCRGLNLYGDCRTTPTGSTECKCYGPTR